LGVHCKPIEKQKSKEQFQKPLKKKKKAVVVESYEHGERIRRGDTGGDYIDDYEVTNKEYKNPSPKNTTKVPTSLLHTFSFPKRKAERI
jgi:hypothetical protein